MAEITPTKQNIFTEETQFRSSVNESVQQKIGGSINFINSFQYIDKSWELNGNYPLGVGSSGVDGVFPFLFNVELTGFWYYTSDVGTSGTTTVDLHRITGGSTDVGSIFTTLPSIDSTASDGSTTVFNAIDNVFLSNPVGHSSAVIDTGESNPYYLNQGDLLRLDLDTSMQSGNNFQFGIYYRPR